MIKSQDSGRIMSLGLGTTGKKVPKTRLFMTIVTNVEFLHYFLSHRHTLDCSALPSTPTDVCPSTLTASFRSTEGKGEWKCPLISSPSLTMLTNTWYRVCIYFIINININILGSTLEIKMEAIISIFEITSLI